MPPPRLELGICHLAGGRDVQFTTGANNYYSGLILSGEAFIFGHLKEYNNIVILSRTKKYLAVAQICDTLRTVGHFGNIEAS